MVVTAANPPHTYSEVFVDKDERGCFIDQTIEPKNILKIVLENSKNVDKLSETSKSEKSALHSITGKLLWPAVI